MIINTARTAFRPRRQTASEAALDESSYHRDGDEGVTEPEKPAARLLHLHRLVPGHCGKYKTFDVPAYCAKPLDKGKGAFDALSVGGDLSRNEH